MMIPALQILFSRELGAARRELEAYPDEDSIWRSLPGVPNVGGTLALHIAGNLRHFFGGILGKDGYVRNRDAEFARRDVPRTELLRELEAAQASVERTLRRLTDADLKAPFPELIAKRRVSTAVFVAHLAVHLSYHLGQIDYHRRAVTQDGRGVDAVSVRELPEIA